MTVDPLSVARSIHGDRVSAARVVACEPISYDPFLRGRSVGHVSGVAELGDDDPIVWNAVVKRTDGIALRAARRELSSYRDGVVGQGASAGFRAPAMYAAEDGEDHVELWLEPLRDQYDGQWPVARFGVAAGHIGAWDAAMMEGADVPGFDSEDEWAKRHGQPHRVVEAIGLLRSLRNAADADKVMVALDDDGFRKTEALIASTVSRIERLATFPQTLLHHDLVRSNLFAQSDSVTAVIDWENVGRAPLGVDLAPLVCGSVRRGEASADELPAIENLVVLAYEKALREAGVDPIHLRPAYRLALGLRWHVVLGTIEACLDPTSAPRRGSRPAESRSEALSHLVSLSRHLLDAAE